MTTVKPNYGFHEEFLSVRQREVTNNLGRTVEHLEIAYLDGVVGECREYDGIADGASGMLNIDAERTIGTNQINVTDTFVVDGVVSFLTGGSAAAGEVRAGMVAGAVPLGICVSAVNGASGYVTFRPFKQDVGVADAIKTTVVNVATDISTGNQLAVPEIPVGAEILGMEVISRATVSSGTITLEQADGTDICLAAAATANAKASTASIAAANTVGADGVQLLGYSNAVRGIVIITWR